MNPIKQIAALGRGGDTELALTSAREREMLRRMGGSGTINPYTGLLEYKGRSGDESEPPPPPDTSPIIDTPNANPAFTVAHPEFASYQQLYRMEHGMAKDAPMPAGWAATKPKDKAILYMKYNSVTPEASRAYYDYSQGLSGKTFTDQKLYNTEKRRADLMEGLNPRAISASYGQYAPSIIGGQVNTNIPYYMGEVYGNQYVSQPYAKGGAIKGDDMNQYEALAAHGRGGDSDLALTSEREREMLRRMGGSGTINPYTGLREYKESSPFDGNPLDAIKPPPVQTYDASSVNTSLTPISSVAAKTDPTYTAPTEMRIVPQTDPLAPSGQSGLSKLMRMYGVSTPSMSSYLGADKPVAPGSFSGTAPTALSGRVTQDQIDDYNAARNAYNASAGAYNTSIGDYNTALDKYGLNQAQYDLYANEYNKRMQSPVDIYAQQQFGYNGDPVLPTDVLLAPTYAQGGSVRGYAEGDIVEIDGEDYVPVVPPVESAPLVPYADMAALRNRYQVENAALNDMITKYIDNPSSGKRDDSEMYFRLASAFLSPTKTKQGFMENLGMAGKEMAEYSGAKRATEREQMKMRLDAQKIRRDMTKDEMELEAKMRKAAGSGPVNPLTGTAYTSDDWKNARLRYAEYREVNSVTGERGGDVRVEDFLPGRALYDPSDPRYASTPQAPPTIADATGVYMPSAPVPPGAGTPSGASTSGPGDMPPKVSVAEQTAYVQATAKAKAERETAEKALRTNMQRILNIAGVDPETGKDEIETLIRASTSGGAQNLITQGERFFGKTNAGAKAIQALTSRLNRITYQLVGNKLDRGITDTDIVFLKEINGNIADPNFTAEERLFAWKDALNYIEQIVRNDPNRHGASGKPLYPGEGKTPTSRESKTPAPREGKIPASNLPRRNSKGWELRHDPVNNAWAYVGPNDEIEEVQ